MDISKSLTYFHNLIDVNGILQFSKLYEKDYDSGYAIEDQARALILALKLNDPDLINHFSNLIRLSWTKGKGVDTLRLKDGTYSGVFDGYREASAEVLWALGELGKSYPGKRVELQGMFSDLAKGLLRTNYTRVVAYSILGLCGWGEKNKAREFGEKLVDYFEKYLTADWPWFEEEMTYANALLPWALFTLYSLTKESKFLNVGEKSLNFLLTNLSKDNIPLVVGTRGWWKRGGMMALYDQQPIDVSYLVLASISAYKVTKNEFYLKKARFYYSWFEGNNLKKVRMIRDDGACFDGLWEDRLNRNGGAESIICYLLASLELKNLLK